MSVTPSPIGGFAGQFFDNNGQPLSGGKIYTYAAGTTTPQATYTSALGITPHANPIILDSAGRVPGGEIWLTDGLIYKFVIETATAILIGTYDNITGVNSNFVNYTVQEEVITATAGQTVFNLTTINYTPGTNSLSVYIDGVNQYVGDSYLETDSDTVTFTAGLHVGAEVKFTTAVQITTGAIDANTVGYTASFTGAVGQTVQTKLEQYVSVKDFGAVGDGVTDDSTAIQAALTAGAGRAVYFPGGTYLISATLTVPADTMVTGDGYGSVVYQDTRERNVFSLNNNCTVQHLRLRGDGVTSGGASFQLNNGISAVSKRNIKVLNCFLHAFESNGIYIDDCENLEIIGNYIWDNAYSVGSGSDIVLYGVTGGTARIIISKNFCFSNNSQGIYVDAIGVDTDILVEGNVCVTLNPTTWAEVSSGSLLRRHGIILGYNGASGRFVAVNNLCRNTRQTGIYYQGGTASVDGVQILGNQCTKNGVNAIEPSLSSGIYIATQGNGDIIANNLVEDFSNASLYGSAGIKIAPADASQLAANPYTLVTNNIVRSSASHGILLTSRATNVEVRGNGVTNSTYEDIAWIPTAALTTVGNHSIKDNRVERTNTSKAAIFCDFQASTLPMYVENNYLLGSDKTVNSVDNVGVKWTTNPNIFVTGNTISGFYHGVFQANYLIGRAFSQQFIDRNSFLNCTNGIMVAGTSTAPVLPVQDNVFVNVTTKASGAALGFDVVYIAQRFGDKIYFQSATAPAVGTWVVGDRAQQLTPVVGQPKGWMCTVAGNPGTWVSEGNL